MWFHYLIVLVGGPIVLAGIIWMYLIESKYLDGFKLEEEDGIE